MATTWFKYLICQLIAIYKMNMILRFPHEFKVTNQFLCTGFIDVDGYRFLCAI